MTIEELNKLIQEELKAYLNEEQTDEHHCIVILLTREIYLATLDYVHRV